MSELPPFPVFDNEGFMDPPDDLLADFHKQRAEAYKARLEVAMEALNAIGCFDDRQGNRRLEETGSYSAFDEPGSVKNARNALKQIGDLP